MRLLTWWRDFHRHILHALAHVTGDHGHASLTLPLRRTPAGKRVVLAGVLLLAMGMQPAFGTDKPLVFGVFPNMTAWQIVEIYHPLADALEKRLQRRVVMYSARDFKTFVERTREGDYDILMTAPHLAWLARQEAGYRPLLKYSQPVRGLLVVKSDSLLDAPEALRGRTIATADAMSLAGLAVHAKLAELGLKRDIDYQTADSGTHTNAMMQVVNGRVDAAMLGLQPYNLLPSELRQQVRVLVETPPLSSVMYLSHPRLRDAEAHAVRRALLEFAATPAGQAFMQRGGYGGFTDTDGHELSAFRPYALQAQDILRTAR